MGLLRIVLYLLCGVILWHIGKRLFRVMTPSTEEHTVPPPLQKRGPVVRCAHCGLHIPKQEAFTRNEVFFCCEEHRKVFLERQE